MPRMSAAYRHKQMRSVRVFRHLGCYGYRRFKCFSNGNIRGHQVERRIEERSFGYDQTESPAARRRRGGQRNGWL